MKRLPVLVAAVVMAAAVTAAPTVAQASQPARPALQKELDAIVAGGATGVLAQVRDDHGVWRGSSGVADLRTGSPVPANGTFRAGSITKTFVATVIMQLVGEHRIGLDDTVEKWLPGVVPNGAGITIRQLLNQTSGLYDVTHTLPLSPPSAFLGIRWRTWTLSELARRAVAQPPASDPGTWNYSSTNYVLLGMVLRRVTGHSYESEVERRVIRPLHLNQTSLPGTDPRIPGPHAHGYIPDEANGLVDITKMNPSVMGSAGALISSADDLNRFYAALLGGRLLRPEQLRQMQEVAPGSGVGYALGIRRANVTCAAETFGHDGDALGYSSWSFTNTATHRQITVSITWGANEPDAAVDNMLQHALC